MAALLGRLARGSKAAPKPARLSALAQELVAKNPAIIVTQGGQAVAAASKAAPRTPIVMTSSGDPVAAGFAASLAHPGGMITGITNISTDLSEKLLELLLAAVPKVKRVGFLVNSSNVTFALQVKAAQRSIARHSIEGRFAEVARPGEIETAISKLTTWGAQALVVMSSSLFNTERRRIVALALARRWAVVAGNRDFSEDGGLITYGYDPAVNFRRAAFYVDRILKGVKPGDLPIEQPTKVELVLNMKTARALKLKIPQELAVRADKVIE